MDHRAHRKVITVDGETAFIGGAGIADQWLTGDSRGPAWRDTRVRGIAVAGVVSVFPENWVDSSGELLSGGNQFPAPGQSRQIHVYRNQQHAPRRIDQGKNSVSVSIDCARHNIPDHYHPVFSA